jgi:hypothetical protein
VVNHKELPAGVAAVLWTWFKGLRATPRFRHQAWREFQRALDPLASPKELPQQFRQ